MSRGPGRIERAIEIVFDTERDNAFTLEDLCERVYSGVNRIEKKHRVAIARAARNLSRRRPEIQCYESGGLGGALVFFRHDEVVSYAMARLKADNLNRYRSNDPRALRISDENDLRRELGNDRHRQWVEPGGVWWNHVHIFLAEQAGDDATATRLEAENRAFFDAIRAELSMVRLR